MFLTYIDESGKPDFNQEEGIFGLSAICIHGSLWNTMDRQLRTIKERHFPDMDPSEVEIHLKDIARGKKRPFHQQTTEQKIALLDDCFNLIASSECSLISVLVDKSKKYTEEFDIERYCLQYLFERICWHLDAQNRRRTIEDLSPELALLFIDSDPHHDDMVSEKLMPFYYNGSSSCKNRWVARHPIFMESYKDCMLQLVDLVTYSSRRAFSTSRRPDNLWDQKNLAYFNQLKPRMFTNTNGRIENYGLKIFPRGKGG